MNRIRNLSWITFLAVHLMAGGMWAWNAPIAQPENDSVIESTTGGEALKVSIQEDSEQVQERAEDLLSDWQKPDIALFITGRQHGYIEPCGCITLAKQKGGLMRRHTVMQILQSRGWDLIGIDAGNQIRRFGQQPIMKLRHTYRALCQAMGYKAIGFGVDDLRIPTIDLIQVMADVTGQDNPFVCANVDIMQAGMQSPWRVVETGGRKVGIVHVLGAEHVAALRDNGELALAEPQEAIQALVPAIQQSGCDMMVLLAQASLDESRELARKFPVFDLVVTAGGAGDPTLHPEMIDADGRQVAMIQVGVKGMYVGVVGVFFDNGRREMKYSRVPLDSRFEDSPAIKQIFLDYQNELKALYTSGRLADIKPRKHPSGYTFVGSESCNDCHDEEYEIWEDGTDGEGGPHFRATLDLTEPGERTWVQRHYDPECLSCHVTGWNPQKYYPYESGYLDLERDAHLHGNGCENCHGPGSAHVAAENGDVDADDATLEKLRGEMRLTLAEARDHACMECHDLDNSPPFFEEGAFDRYWAKIKH